MTSKQKTLFQSWGRSVSQSKPQTQISKSNDQIIDLCDNDLDEDDALLAQALDETTGSIDVSINYHQPRASTSTASINHHQPRLSTASEHTFKNKPSSTSQSSLFNKYGGSVSQEDEDVGNVSFGVEDIDTALLPSDSQIPDLDGFDKQSGRLWIYPTNYPIRDYQFNIVHQCLFKNTLVSLPTGLGKTFIAAVVMYNFYRWYPQGKVIFMAPTKPLVAQQIDACYNIMGIPQSDTAEMTGTMNPTERRRVWKERRVFFLTPQVMTNDLSRGTCPADNVRCLVIDEAHKALGNHAYCQVVRELVKYTQHFRIVALSATPGSDIKSVQLVISNLLISHIELRTEECLDIKPYTHERKVDKIVVPLGEELLTVKNKYIQIMTVVVQRLTRQRALYNREVTSLSKFLILKAREAFRQNPPENLPSNQYGVVEGDFALALSLYHGFELLQLHGLRSLYNFLENIVSGEKGYGRTKTELLRSNDFNEIMNMLKTKFNQDESSWSSTQKKANHVSGHPKMKKLEEVVLDHFKKVQQNGNGETRVMIFSQYRDSVQEITDLLNLHSPTVQAMSFIGQSSAGKKSKGFTQKEQLKVMQEFREGGYNTLVSTCVGEEGLDIGDVDLIICFDAHKSPIRLVQRMGRTGRKREGRIVMLVTQGKEEQIYNQSQYSKRSIHKAIMNGARSLRFYQGNPRMLPDGLSPACHKMYITVKQPDNKQAKYTSNKNKANQSRLGANWKKQAKGKKTSSAEEEMITAEEYDELKDFVVDESDMVYLPPRSTLVCLDNNQQIDNVDLSSMSEWMPWQNRLQDTYLVDHSSRSHHLVELAEFLQLQETLPPDEDHYGIEMNLYLNLEDVLQPGEKDISGESAGILKFCTSSTRSSKQSVKDPTKRGKKRSRNTVRRSETLPDLEDLQVEGDPYSDEDLPQFDVGFDLLNTEKRDENQHDTSPQAGHGPDVSAVRKEKGKAIAEGRRRNGKRNKGKQKTLSKDNSILLPVVVNDVGDFEEDEPDETVGEPDEPDEVVMEVEPVHYENVNLKSENDSVKTEVVPSVSKIQRNFCQFEPEHYLENFRIPSPPAIEEVGRVFQELDIDGQLPALNLAQLVSEWYTEVCNISLSVSEWKTGDNRDGSPMPSSVQNVNKSGILKTVKSSANNSLVDYDNSGITGEKDDHNLEAMETDHEIVDNHELITCDLSSDNKESNDGVVHVENFTSVKGKNEEKKMAQDVTVSSVRQMMSPVLARQTDDAGSKGGESGNSMFISNREINVDTNTRNVPDAEQSEEDRQISRDKSVAERYGNIDCAEDISSLLPASEPENDTQKETEISAKHIAVPVENIQKVETLSISTHESVFVEDSEKVDTQRAPSIARSVKSDTVTFTQALDCLHSSEEHTQDLQDVLPPLAEDGKHFQDGSPKKDLADLNRSKMSEADLVSDKMATAEDEFGSEIDNIMVEMPSFNLFDDDSEFDIPQDVKDCDTTKNFCNRNSSLDENENDTAEKNSKVSSDKSVFPVIKELQKPQAADAHDVDTGDEFDMPHFDLDFDLDDDIIPPSPKPSQTFSQCSIRSQIVCSSRRRLDAHFQQPQSVLETRHKPSSPTIIPDQAHADHDSWNSSFLETDDHESNFVSNEDKDEVLNTVSSASFCKNASRIAPVPTLSTSFPFSPPLKNIRSSTPKVGLSKFSSTSRPAAVAQAVTPVTNEVTSLSKTSPVTDGFDAEVVSKGPTEVSIGITGQESDEDSFSIMRRKKKIAVLDDTDSSFTLPPKTDEENRSFKTPSRPAAKKKVKLDFSSDEDFDDFSSSRSCRFQSDSHSDSNRDLSHNSSMADKHRVKGKTGRLKRKSKKRGGCEFLDKEAELSGSGASSDEDDDTDDDVLDASFVNDDTEMSQNDVDMHAVYLKSVRSPSHIDRRFRLKDRHFNMDVFSQVPEEDDSHYQEDSFCVGDDHEFTEYTHDDDDLLDDLEEFSRYSKRKNSKQKTKKPTKNKTGPSRKRIRQMSGSSSEEEKHEHSLDQTHCGGNEVADFLCSQKTEPVRKKAAVLFSSSEEETSPKYKPDRAPSDKKPRLTSLSEARSMSPSHQGSDGNRRTSDPRRDERLAKQRQKQEEFRRKLAEKNASKLSTSSRNTDIDKSEHNASCRNSKDYSEQASSNVTCTGADGSGNLEADVSSMRHNSRNKSSFIEDEGSKFGYEDYDFVSDKLSTSVAKPLTSSTSYKGKVVVLIDSREISGAQDIVSDLRLKHSCTVAAKQLSGCDYILSNRMAVDRRQMADFSNGTNRGKLVERIQHMRDLYDRCCLIVEKDRVKPGEEKAARASHRTKYFDWIQAVIIQTNVRLFFTDNQGETAALIAELAEREKKNGMNITVPVEVSPDKEHVVKFFASIPRVSYVHALNLCYNFRNVSEFLCSCTPTTVSTRGRMSEARAAEVCNYVRHKFDLQMLPTKR